MTAFPISKFISPSKGGVFAAVFMALALTAIDAGWTQEDPSGTGTPRRLTPLRQTPASQPPPAEEPLGPALRTGALPTAQPSDKTRIVVDALGTIDPDSAGTLSEEEGGLGVDMWGDTSRNLVETLLPQLPSNTTSPAMRNLMRKLLLTTATAPGIGTTTSGTRAGGLVAIRIELLAAMGDTAGASELLEATPGRDEDERLVQIEADLRFLANDNARACGLASSQIGVTDNSFWHQAFIFCQALAGEHAKAALGLSLLRETGTEDAVFSTLVDALARTGVVVIDSMPEPRPLHLAMARVANAQLPADVIASNNLGILRAIATSPNASVELRLEAAERAGAAGAMPDDALRQLYSSVPFTDDELANPLSRTEAESGPLSRALLYRTAMVRNVPTAQAEAVTRALELAREGGRYASTVRAFLPILEHIPPSAEMMWFAPEMIRALLVSGEHEAARSWFAILRAGSMFNQETADSLAALMPLTRIAGSEGAENWSIEDLAAWWELERDRDDASTRAALLFTLLESLGDQVPRGLWEALLEGPQRTMVAMPRTAIWNQLAMAAESGRTGETVLLALLALGEGGPAVAEPVVLRRVLTSLGGIGLEESARAMAVEAAVAAGL